MTSKTRTLSGIALMLLLIPIFAGLLACMPVPIGDPERSRIDPELSGIWVSLGNEATIDESALYIFEPWDKRTWLVSGVGIAAGEDSEVENYDLTSYAGYAEMAANETVAEDHIFVPGIVLYKAWLKKLGGEWFMTWEPKGLLDDGIPEPEVWFVYRVFKDKKDHLRLQYVDPDSDLFDEVDETRRAYERVIARNVDNPQLYGDGDDTEASVAMVRVREDELSFFEKLIETVIIWN